MVPRRIATAALGLFVVVSLVYAVVDEATRTAPARRSAEPEAAAGRRVLVYYFHGDRRCVTCRRIETYAEETVRTRFAQAMRDGELEWRVVNMDRDENMHFVTEFELLTSSVVVVETDAGETGSWQNLEQVWDLVGEKGLFCDYVADEVRTHLEKEP